ncbi:MAG: hypothetical protein R2795_12375 [Saprospiraceae bacterium]
MNKRFLLLTLSIIWLAAGQVVAQHHPSHPPRHLGMTDEMKATLQLTEQQTAEIDEILLHAKEKAQALRDNEDLAPDAKKEQLRAMHHDTKKAVDAVLSDTQRTQLKQLIDEHRAEHRALMANVDHQGMREELKAYRKANIKPVLLAQRQSFDALLTPEEKDQLASIRTTLQAARRTARQQGKHSKAEDAPRGGSPIHHRPKDSHKGLAAQFPDAFATLEALADKYAAALDAVQTTLAPQRQQWHADQKAIRDRYLPQDRPVAKQDAPDRQNIEERHAHKAYIRFLLMDPNNNPDEEGSRSAQIPVSIYPNPAGATAQIKLTLETAATVRLELKDEKGTLLKTIGIQRLQQGINTIDVDLSNVPNGTFYLHLFSRELGLRQVEKMVVVK